MGIIIDDNRKEIVEEWIRLDDGLYKYKTNKKNIAYYYFFGENATYKKFSKRKLSTDIMGIINLASSIGTTPPSPGGGQHLIGVSGPDGVVYMGDIEYYTFNTEYIELPPDLVLEIPENKKEVKRTQISSSGYTLSGDIIIEGGSKGLITSISQVMEDSLIPKQGIIDDGGLGLITSVSKSNLRFINNKRYYDVSITYQEI